MRGRRAGQLQAQPPPQQPPPLGAADGWNVLADRMPNVDSFRITWSLAQVGHATAVADPGRYFSNSAWQLLQRYS